MSASLPLPARERLIRGGAIATMIAVMAALMATGLILYRPSALASSLDFSAVPSSPHEGAQP